MIEQTYAEAWLEQTGGQAAAEGYATARELVRAYCGRTLDYVADDTVTVRGTRAPVLVLGEAPVLDVAAVILGGKAVEDYTWTRWGELVRLGRWGDVHTPVEVTYSHGYAVPSVPGGTSEDGLVTRWPAELETVVSTLARRLATNPFGLARWQGSRVVGDATESEAWTAEAASGFTVAERLVLNRYRRRCGV